MGKYKRQSHLEDLRVGAKIILKWNLNMMGGDVDWINLAQEREKWQAVLNTVMNHRVL
jgi:hypothetical protein